MIAICLCMTVCRMFSTHSIINHYYCDRPQLREADTATHHLADGSDQPAYLLTWLFRRILNFSLHQRPSGKYQDRGCVERHWPLTKIHNQTVTFEKFLPTQALCQEFLCHPFDMLMILSCHFSNKYFWYTYIKCLLRFECKCNKATKQITSIFTFHKS